MTRPRDLSARAPTLAGSADFFAAVLVRHTARIPPRNQRTYAPACCKQPGCALRHFNHGVAGEWARSWASQFLSCASGATMRLAISAARRTPTGVVANGSTGAWLGTSVRAGLAALGQQR